ncbi:MAG: hypothetical protein D6722_23490, partial [Bacteroidetes bacterium]
MLRFGTFYLLVRALSREDFGIWTLYITIITVYEFIRASMVQQALVRYLSGKTSESEAGRINTASLAMHAGITLLGGGLILGLSLMADQVWGTAQLGEMLGLYLLCTLLLLPYFQFNFIQQANLQFAGIFFSNLIRYSLLFGYVFWGFVINDHGFDLLELVWVQIIAAALASVVSWLFARPYLTFSRQLDRRWVGLMVAFSKYIIGTSGGAMLLKSMDQILLGAMSSPAAVAGFGTTMRITYLVEVPAQSVGAIVFPQSARRIETE